MKTDLFFSPRRELLKAGVGLGAWLWLGPARADSEELAAAIRAFAQGAPIQSGRVQFDISPLVDNGNTVPVTVSVESPMTHADHVTDIAIFNERNPLRDVVRFKLGPRSGKAWVAARIRLATSQDVVAVARMRDGSVWAQTASVNVSIAACLEEIT